MFLLFLGFAGCFSSDFLLTLNGLNWPPYSFYRFFLPFPKGLSLGICF